MKLDWKIFLNILEHYFDIMMTCILLVTKYCATYCDTNININQEIVIISDKWIYRKKILLTVALWKIVYLGQIDGVAIDQRHEYDDVPRRPFRSGEDVQERRAESQRVRDGEAVDHAEHSEQKTNQAHNSEDETIKFGRFSSRRSRYGCNKLT